MKGTGFPIRVLDMDSPFMFGLVREGTPEEREECKAHGRPEDLPVSLLGLDKEGCACVDGEDVAQRLADCWNACTGMENPAEEIAALRNVLAFLADRPVRLPGCGCENCQWDEQVSAMLAKMEGRAEV